MRSASSVKTLLVARWTACAAFLAWSAAACAHSERPATTAAAFSVRDSAGTRIVENSRPLAGGSGEWARVDSEPSLEIGVVQGLAPYTFSWLGGAVEAPNGDIVIVDGETSEIRVFDPEGKHLRTFGGKGGGPGEFRGAPVIRLVPPDTVLAWDGDHHRLTWFTLAGEFVRDRSLTGSAAMRASALEWGVNIWQLLPDGTAIGQSDTGYYAQRDGLMQEPLRLVAVRVASGDVWATRNLPEQPKVYVGNTQARAILYPTIGPHNWAVRVAPPSLVVADDPEGRWVLSVYDLDGALTGSVRTAVPRRAVTHKLADSARTLLRERARGYLSGRSLMNAMTGVDRIPMPDSTPAISAVFVDDQDRLWVERWSGGWEKAGMDTYDVLDRSGRWLGWVAVRRGSTRLLSVGYGHLLFEWRGPLGVSHVRQYRVHRIVESTN